MHSTQIKRKVKEFRREYGLQEITSETLAGALERQGFTIIPFNPVLNDPDVETVIKSFGLQEMIRHSNGFMYLDQSHRLIFLKEDLTDQERSVVLAHEEGHYYCGHTFHENIAGRDVTEEFEANEFVHYLLNKNLPERCKDAVLTHKKRFMVLVLLVLTIACAGTVVKHYREQQIYEGEFYVTIHGKKYHRKDCVTIEGHEIRRLTLEDVKTGRYEPCNVCKPDE